MLYPFLSTRILYQLYDTLLLNPSTHDKTPAKCLQLEKCTFQLLK